MNLLKRYSNDLLYLFLYKFFTAGMSAGAQSRESKFSLCSHINFECSLAVGISDVSLHLAVTKFTIISSYS